MCEALLFMASRAQLVHERVRPALEEGKVVLCDRFISATLAYQGASGIDKNLIIELGEIAVQGLWPDLTIILDVPVEEGMQRIGIVRKRLKKGRQPNREQLPLFGDRMEARKSTYHERVREIFREVHKLYPRPVRYVDAKGSPDEVLERIKEELRQGFCG